MRLATYHLDRIIASPERIPTMTPREVIMVMQSYAFIVYSQSLRREDDAAAGHALWAAREFAGAWLAANPAKPKSDHHRYRPWAPEHASVALDRAAKLLKGDVSTDSERLDVARGVLCRLTIVAARDGVREEDRRVIAAALRVLGAPS